MGNNEASPETKPTVIPSLQNRGVISIVLGDYHWGALLEDGKLLTWGAACSTGLGDPFEIEPGKPGGFRTTQERNRGLDTHQSIPDVTEPTEVRFDHNLEERRNMFVFAAAASGWHMGALVMDLDEVRYSCNF
jgi:SCF-associated factor 1